MKMFNRVPDVYLYRDFVDFRKSINGLSLIVEQQMQLSPLNGSVYVFCNKNKDKLKVLYWDKTGFALWYKRLEKQRFKWLKADEDDVLCITGAELNRLLDGLDIFYQKPHKSLFYDSMT